MVRQPWFFALPKPVAPALGFLLTRNQRRKPPQTRTNGTRWLFHTLLIHHASESQAASSGSPHRRARVNPTAADPLPGHLPPRRPVSAHSASRALHCDHKQSPAICQRKDRVHHKQRWVACVVTVSSSPADQPAPRREQPPPRARLQRIREHGLAASVQSRAVRVRKIAPAALSLSLCGQVRPESRAALGCSPHCRARVRLTAADLLVGRLTSSPAGVCLPSAPTDEQQRATEQVGVSARRRRLLHNVNPVFPVVYPEGVQTKALTRGIPSPYPKSALFSALSLPKPVSERQKAGAASTHISLFVLTGSELHKNVYVFTQLCTVRL